MNMHPSRKTRQLVIGAFARYEFNDTKAPSISQEAMFITILIRIVDQLKTMTYQTQDLDTRVPV
jgi:hypothetical protein